ncbi:MAG: peptidylprolyl isomerase [Candidatus Omnitrophota bacterium]
MRYAVIFLCAAAILAVNTQTAGAESPVIHTGSKVAFDYTLTVDGKMMDSSEGKGPINYVQGDGRLIVGLAKALEGMRAGEEKTVTVPPAEAYGTMDPKAVREVPRSSLPTDREVKVGMMLQAKDAKGGTLITRVAEIRKDTVLMDFNHPLAGKTLIFKVKIVSVT